MAILMPKSMATLNEDFKPLYPLFQKPSKTLPLDPATVDLSGPPLACEEADAKKATSKEKKQRKSSAGVKKKAESKSNGTKDTNTDSSELLDVDPNNGRRKRRKTASPDGKLQSNGNGNEVKESTPLPQKRGRKPRIPVIEEPSSPPPGTIVLAQSEKEPKEVINVALETPAQALAMGASEVPTLEVEEDVTATTASISSNPIREAPSLSEDTKNGSLAINQAITHELDTSRDVVENKPKKILRLNPKTGTFGSPKKVVQVEETGPRKRSAKVKVPKTNLVTIQYGNTTGQKIEAIMSGNRIAASFKKDTALQEITKPPKTMKIAGTGPIATPHPFFMPKAAPNPLPTSEKVAMLISNVPPKPKASTSVSAFTGFSSNAGLLRFPGAIEPSWPWKGMIHTRGHDEEPVPFAGASKIRSRAKKSKYQATTVLKEEDILQSLASELCIKQILEELNDIDPNEYPPVPACLRVPMRHFESGPNLQSKLRNELKTRIPLVREPDSSEDEIQGSHPIRSHIHPALTKAYSSVANSLSAFDKSECEIQAWTQKYSPTSAAEVLQTGREALILKEWLLNLTVVAVESGDSKRAVSAKPEVTAKRKRRSKKLDGFVISSDEEDDMDEISEPEDESTPHGSQVLPKTVIRAGNASKDSSRFSNGLVISGPHGCGKSAAVYAVAKELGFEVFEINSNSRRSGKDIMEKVGDMTRNHLVQHSHSNITSDPVDEDAKKISDALDNDLKSGRQGTMNSFFETKVSTKEKPKPKKSAPVKKAEAGKQQKLAPKAPPKKQKQSLILFEEVDVLYEEDKQFWATVMDLLVRSKRPIVMTCTDESAVPLQSLALHAILRLSSPPVDLATDYLLLVAASEGHLLQREAVKTLYEGRQLDLRASLTEINFWCQFAVGSFKGGLDWFYERWPPGKDLDEDGKIKRVVSEGTYEAGMGWLSQDFLESHVNYLDIEVETLDEAWTGWRLDAGDWPRSLDLVGWAEKLKTLSTRKSHMQSTLAMYDDFAESLSAADICSSGAFSSENQVVMDTSLPALSLKVREDYILSHELIEATPLADFSNMGQKISIWMKSRSRNYLQVDQHVKRDLEVPAELDRPTEEYFLNLIRAQDSHSGFAIKRHDYSLAFDPISEAEKPYVGSTGSLEASSFDRTMTMIATDIAPYVRSIVSYDARLQQERARLSNLLSESGRSGKRMRTTRAAMSALEGGARSTTRKEKYFGSRLNSYLVLKTGKQSWLDAARSYTVPVLISRPDEEDLELCKAEDTADSDE